MKPIETFYKGYRFRSRLEARWAVFFSRLGWTWQYEVQGFSLPSGPYLPDFYVPNFGGWEPPGGKKHPEGWRGIAAYWIEIKPFRPSEREKALMLELAASTKHHVHCLAGRPWPDEFDQYVATISGKWIEYDRSEWPSEFQLYGLRCNCEPTYAESGPEFSTALLSQAFYAAAGARWEYGEVPQ